jgi:hypothetical protein
MPLHKWEHHSSFSVSHDDFPRRPPAVQECAAPDERLYHEQLRTPRRMDAVASVKWDASRVDTLLRLRREDQIGREGLAQGAAAQDTATLFVSLRADSARTRWLRTSVA